MVECLPHLLLYPGLVVLETQLVNRFPRLVAVVAVTLAVWAVASCANLDATHAETTAVWVAE